MIRRVKPMSSSTAFEHLNKLHEKYARQDFARHMATRRIEPAGETGKRKQGAKFNDLKPGQTMVEASSHRRTRNGVDSLVDSVHTHAGKS